MIVTVRAALTCAAGAVAGSGWVTSGFRAGPACVLAFSGAREWRNRQTRTVQVRVPERVWGFNSPLAHQHDRLSSPGTGAFVVLC